MKSGVKDFAFNETSMMILMNDGSLYRRHKIDGGDIKVDIDGTDCTSMKMLDDGRLALSSFKSNKAMVSLLSMTDNKSMTCQLTVNDKSRVG